MLNKRPSIKIEESILGSDPQKSVSIPKERLRTEANETFWGAIVPNCVVLRLADQSAKNRQAQAFHVYLE